jgi:hypothetical protein
VEASNSCARTLIFNSPSFIAFLCQFFFFFAIFPTFLCFSFFIPFPPLFSCLFFISAFWLIMWVSCLAYPTLLGTKRLGCCYKRLNDFLLYSIFLFLFFIYGVSYRNLVIRIKLEHLPKYEMILGHVSFSLSMLCSTCWQEIHIECGKGLVQKRESEARLKELEEEKSKPFARTRYMTLPIFSQYFA